MLKLYFTTQPEKTGFNSGPAITNAVPSFDLATIEKSFRAIKASGGKVVRLDFNMQWALHPTEFGGYEPLHKEFHKQIFKLLAQLDLTPAIVINSTMPNRSAYRSFAASALNDSTLLTTTVFDKYNNRRRGINEVFWPMMNKWITEVLRQGATEFSILNRKWANTVTVEFENEGGYVIDSEYKADPSIPYGTYPSNFPAMMLDRVSGPNAVNLFGAILLPTSYENMGGIDTELATSTGPWTDFTPWVNIHLYVPYASGDTAATLATKLITRYKEFAAKVDAIPSLKGKPIAITEFGVANLPQALRLSYLTAIGRALVKSSSRITMAIAYSMVEISYDWTAQDFIPSKWGILDFETLKYGTVGYVKEVVIQ